MNHFFAALKDRLCALPKLAVIVGASVLAAAILAVGGILIYHNFAPVELKGIDVSNYQGEISWRAIKESGKVRFAYIKATEGTTYQDKYFVQNWNGAAKYGIVEGAYHFFTMTSSGADQADNFIKTVPKEKGKLPPAVDVETSITKVEDFKTQLSDYVKAVEAHYGQKPVFYVTDKVYNILYDNYVGYKFWIIDYNGTPDTPGWVFWQYSDKGTSPGIDGKIDLDRYHGSLWAFNHMLSK